MDVSEAKRLKELERENAEPKRLAIWIECARLLNSHDVVRVLDQLLESRGHPAIINGHEESFNGVLRDGCLNRWAFVAVREAQLVVESWRRGYNEERPHGALNQITPAAYAAGVGHAQRAAA
jgi:transposase InsO family protein